MLTGPNGCQMLQPTRTHKQKEETLHSNDFIMLGAIHTPTHAQTEKTLHTRMMSHRFWFCLKPTIIMAVPTFGIFPLMCFTQKGLLIEIPISTSKPSWMKCVRGRSGGWGLPLRLLALNKSESVRPHWCVESFLLLFMCWSVDGSMNHLYLA